MVITTSTSAAVAIPRNRIRKSFVIQNIDASINIFLKRERGPVFTVSSTDFDIRLGPGAAIALSSMLDGTEAIQDSFAAVAASGTPQMAFFETEDQTR